MHALERGITVGQTKTPQPPKHFSKVAVFPSFSEEERTTAHEWFIAEFDSLTSAQRLVFAILEPCSSTAPVRAGVQVCFLGDRQGWCVRTTPAPGQHIKCCTSSTARTCQMFTGETPVPAYRFAPFTKLTQRGIVCVLHGVA